MNDPLRIAIVVSTFNEHITKKLEEGCLAQLKAKGHPVLPRSIFYVPGAVEIPLTAQLLAQTKHYEAIIALGCVIRGDTDHYQYVCEQVSNGCQAVSLRYDIPVIFGVLTTNNEEQALDRCGGTEGHKGKEAADAALSMVELKKHISLLDFPS